MRTLHSFLGANHRAACPVGRLPDADGAVVGAGEHLARCDREHAHRVLVPLALPAPEQAAPRALRQLATMRNEQCDAHTGVHGAHTCMPLRDLCMQMHASPAWAGAAWRPLAALPPQHAASTGCKIHACGHAARARGYLIDGRGIQGKRLGCRAANRMQRSVSRPQKRTVVS